MEDLLVKFFSGEASKSEQQKVKEWRSSSPENSSAFLEAKQVWVASCKPEKPNQALLDSILNEGEEIKVIPIWQTGLFKFAASLLIILGAVFAVYQIGDSNNDMPGFAQVRTETLPDGTEVSLHKGAQLEVLSFDQERRVRLTGKAYFDVERDETKPFLIETENALVRVLGTSFVVNSNPKSELAEVLVESGVVAFSDKDEKSKVELIKGEKAVLNQNNAEIQKSEIDGENYLAWKTHNISFRKSSLKEVSDIIEDVYEVDVVFSNDDLGQCRLTAKFSEKRIDEVIDIISKTFNIDSKIEKGTVTFAGSGCN
ncbi:MAG: FecR domain-containing protein [Cyclobacteriaceae bacterium]